MKQNEGAQRAETEQSKSDFTTTFLMTILTFVVPVASSFVPFLAKFSPSRNEKRVELTTSEVYFSNLHSLIDILALVLVHCNFFSQTEQSRKVEAPGGNDHDLRDPQGKKAGNRNESERWKTPSDLRELFCRRTKCTPVHNPNS